MTVTAPARRSDDGFGLIEIVISMLILAVLAVSLLPLLIQGVRTASSNASQATAGRLVHDRIEQARASETCAAVASLAGTITLPADERGDIFIVTGSTPAACPTSYPAVVSLSISVADSSAPAKPVASATTLVLVTGAG